jgi:hypothetical protein
MLSFINLAKSIAKIQKQAADVITKYLGRKHNTIQINECFEVADE